MCYVVFLSADFLLVLIISNDKRLKLWYPLFAIKKQFERGDVPMTTEHENWPFFATESKKLVYILADFGNRNTGGHGNFYFD